MRGLNGGNQMSEEKTATLSPKLEEVAKTIEGLTALELAELVKGLEDRLGIQAAAPMAAGMMMQYPITNRMGATVSDMKLSAGGWANAT